MNNSNTLQLVLEMGGITFLSIAAALAAAFMVFWHMLGKKHTSVTKQQRTMPELQHPALKKVMIPSTPSPVSLGRASFQQ